MNTATKDYTIEPDPEMDALLHGAAPRVTPKDSALASRLRAMALAAAEAQRRTSRRKQGIAAAILTPFLVVGGAGAAFAATTVDWSAFWGNSNSTEWASWAEHPDATVNYTLPNGGTCELRLGEFRYAPDADRPSDVEAAPQSVAAALHYLQTGDVLADADVEGAILENRSDENWADDGAGGVAPFGYGTENYNADVEYELAVQEAVHEAIIAHLDGLGIPSTGLFFQGQEQCTGMNQ